MSGHRCTPPRGRSTVGFAHSDVDALIARLSGTAERVTAATTASVYFDDPDGIEIEFVQKL